MRKTDKKLENQLRIVLTEVCEDMLKRIDGFQWLTHLANYANFPKSLKVVFIFDTNQSLAHFLGHEAKELLLSQVHDRLSGIGVTLKSINLHVDFDTEEDCDSQNNGNWNERFKQKSARQRH